MDRITIYSRQGAEILFDKRDKWFHYVIRGRQYDYPLGIYRVGHFDLTDDEMSAISDWILELLEQKEKTNE
jgi:hypothetical protein